MSKVYTDEKSVVWVEYKDPLAPEKANPYKWVDGYMTEKGKE